MSDIARPPIFKLSKFSFAIGSLAFGLKSVALGLVMLFYNQVMGLPAAWVSTGIGIALIVDAIVDPLIGQISDTWHSRWGRRHPFMYASAVPASIAVWALLNPPQGLPIGSLFIYMLTCVIGARVFISMFEIPSASLLPELATSYDDRTVMSTYRTLVGIFFPIMIVVIAMATLMTPFVNTSGQKMPGQLNPVGYANYGIMLAVFIFLSILLSAVGTHREIKYLHVEKKHETLADLIATIRYTLLDKNFLALSIAGVVSGIGAGLVGGLTEYFNTYFWELSATQLSTLTGSLLISPIAAAILGPYMAKKFGKKKVAIWNFSLSMLCGILPVGLRTLGLLPPNGSPIILPLLIVDSALAVTLVIIGLIVTTSMMADIVEQVMTKSGKRSEGLIFSADTMLKQIVTGVGSMGTGIILNFIKFPDKAVPGQVDAEVLHRMALIYLPITITTSIIAIAMISFYSISRDDHERNLAKVPL